MHASMAAAVIPQDLARTAAGVLALAGNYVTEHPDCADPILRAIHSLNLDAGAPVHNAAVSAVRAYYATRHHHTVGAAAWRRPWTDLTAYLDSAGRRELLFHLARQRLMPGDGITFPT